MNIGTDVHGAQRINPNDFGDHVTFSFILLNISTWIAMTFCADTPKQ